jgi:hypothetical protein
MTANELADKLQELDSKLHLIELFKAATMLRQQQAEIEALKLRELTDEEIYVLAVENGAWKSKESGNVYPDDLELLEFARAILRKASEK